MQCAEYFDTMTCFDAFVRRYVYNIWHVVIISGYSLWWHPIPGSYNGTHRLSWWRHQMETFSALLAFCAGNSPVTGEFSAQRPVTLNFDVFFELCLNKRLSKQWWGWWFETPSHPLCKDDPTSHCKYSTSQEWYTGLMLSVLLCYVTPILIWVTSPNPEASASDAIPQDKATTWHVL